ncbi:MAG TPA: hypothetical protein VGK67_02195 [Myxococcales bacterium]|jgi:hypothetical protein
MDLTVDCYAGHRGEELPRRLRIGPREIEVAEIVDRWLAPEHRYFRLKGGDGKLYLVRHDERTQRWELVSTG